MPGEPEPKMSLVVEKLNKSFFKHAVLSNLSIRFDGAGCVLFLGANGSGKSTLFRILAGLLSPDSGTVHIKSGRSATQVAYYGHEPQVYLGLSVLENLSFFKKLYADTRPLDAHSTQWALGSLLNKQVADLSRGQRARLALCRTFMGNPDIFLLDEPTTNLDQENAERVCQAIAAARDRGCLILVATHDVTRLCAFSREAVLLAHGQVLCHETLGPGGASTQAIPLYQKVNS
jgi:ABC-type multidrug transport system ATPase subunit